MAINWEKEYSTSEPKKSKINWEKEYNPTGFKKRIDTEKANLRSNGLPVSVRDDRSTPTMGGSILRDILKVPATLLVRPGQALASAKGFTPEEQTVKSKYLGDIKTVQTKKDVLSDVGRAIELVSYGVGVGATKNILAQSGKQAAKQIAKRTALEGAVSGFAGSSGRVITNQSGNLKQDLKDILLGTGIGTIAGGALGYVSGRLGGKVLSAEERAMERAVGKGRKFNIPESGSRFDNVPKPSAPLIDNQFNPLKEVTTPKFKTKEGAYVETPKVIPTNQQEFRALNKQSKVDFIGNEVKFLQTTKQNIPSGYQEKMGKIWDKMHPIADTSKVGITPKSTPINKGSIGTEIQNPSLNATGEIKTPEIGNTSSTQIKVPQEQIDTVTADFVRNNPDEKFISQEGNYNKLVEDAINNPEQTRAIAEGKLPPPQGVPQNLYASVAKNIAEQSVYNGDITLLDNLNLNSSRTTLSKGAAEMRASQITSKDNIFDVKYKVENQKIDQLSKEMKKKIEGETNLSSENLMKMIKELHPNKGMVDEIVNSLICK